VNIYQRINEVRKTVDKIVKDKKVEGYMAVTHDNLTALTREHLVTHGIVIVPILQSERTVPTGTFTSRETPFVRYEATYRFDVVNADDPKDCFAAVIGVHAIDHGDKAPGKALSYAKKALVLKLLELESVSEEEGRQEQHKPKAGTHKPSDGAMESLTKERKQVVTDTHTQVVDFLIEDRDADAYGLCESITDPDEKVSLWSMLDSKQRRRIKDQAAKEKH
jgi:hypothetical protein